MKAIEIKDKGENARLVLTERPVPVPASGEILIKVEAAGINRPDLTQAAGHYEPPSGVTDIPGLEVSGTVEKGGDKFKPGDKVCALLSGGGYAEYATAPEGQVLPVPKGFSMVEAAAIPETYFTVWNNLFERGGLKKGESVLIHGGASGIGTTAIQLARETGATVYVTAGSEAKCRACEKLGAATAINYKTEDFVENIRAFTDDRGVDVVLDMIGGDYIPHNLRALADDGRHISIAIQRGRKSYLDLFHIMSKRLVLTGSTLRSRPLAEKARLAQEVLHHVWPLFESGKVKPVIFEALPLDQAQRAHEILQKGEHIGKVVLKVAG